MMLGLNVEKLAEVAKKPFQVYLGWAVLLLLSTFLSFELYVFLGGLSVMLYGGLGLYVGWKAREVEGMDGFKPVLVGLLFGFGVGLVQGLLVAILVTQNGQVASLYDDFVAQVQANNNGEFSREEVLTGMAVSSIVFGPFLWAILFGILGGIGTVTGRYFGGRRTPASEEEEVVEVKKRKNRPNRKFRRRK